MTISVETRTVSKDVVFVSITCSCGNGVLTNERTGRAGKEHQAPPNPMSETELVCRCKRRFTMQHERGYPAIRIRVH